ncbi:hypothetical protein PC110_g10995 [Phytophthora cactorum]|uniref:Uncharacterized protein n=1 Tax=Phytophthora cactorum TaxID=29920 RepID=A0A329S7P7_9STRA|nr:hypothetical protein PC110_g10995 [Phytophthora cactorum]
MPISSDQCKNKLKWLKRKWAEYNADTRATGNAEVEVLDPPGLAQMQEFWSGSAGMNGQTLADSEANGPNFPSDEDADSGSNPQKRTAGKANVARQWETVLRSACSRLLMAFKPWRLQWRRQQPLPAVQPISQCSISRLTLQCDDAAP